MLRVLMLALVASLALVYPFGGTLALAAAGDAEISEASADEARARSEKHYRAGLELFEAGNRAQALVEFQLAYELFPSNDIVFIMAQCEYHLGLLADARQHYERYLRVQPDGTLADTARLRVTAIDRRPSRFVINTVPDDVQVVLEGAGQRLTGEAPNAFDVPRGRYRITVSKPQYRPETRDVEIGIAETKSLFFGLKPVPGRLTIRTVPAKANLFVRGMRAENPYVQDVEQGDYQIYAEAGNHAPRRDTIHIEAGESRDLVFELSHVQRSGKPELVGFWTVLGGVASGAAVISGLRLGEPVASASVITTAVGAGALTGLLLANTFTPDHIQDNLALQRMGFMWVGAAEGMLTGLTLAPRRLTAWVGGGAGLVAGAGAGALLDHVAPDYGTGLTLQSAAMGGVLAGALAVPALQIDASHRDLAMLIGLNAGVAVGLTSVYLLRDTGPGPSWQRVLLVDLGGLAGAFGGAVSAALLRCAQGSAPQCEFDDRQTTATFALVGGAIGVASGWLLTTGLLPKLPDTRVASVTPGVGVVPVIGIDGATDLVPGLSASGLF